MPLVVLRKYWFYTLTLLHTLFDLGALLYNILLWVTDYYRYVDRDIYWKKLFVFQDLFLCLGILNGIYMSTYGYLRSNSIIGSFAFQQVITALLIAMVLGILIWRYRGPEWGYSSWKNSDFILYFVSFTLHALSSSTLWYFFIAGRRAKDDLLGCWTVDVGGLATGTRIPSDRLTWRGAKRSSINEDSYRRRGFKPIGAFISGALFRRVPEVETIPYALFQHSFALAAITLLLTRATTLLTQLRNENLTSRTVVDACPAEAKYYYSEGPITVIVRHPELAGVDNALDPEGVNLGHNMFIEYRLNRWNGGSGSANRLVPCPLAAVRKVGPDSSGANVTDWFHIFVCSALESRSPTPTGFIKYAISSRSQTNTSNIDIFDEHMPSLWLAFGFWPDYVLNPYVAPPIRPIFQTNAYFETRVALRKFISSSPLRDAVTGSKPKYNTVRLHLWSQTHSQQMPPSNGSNTAPHTTGYIRLPGYVSSSLQTPGNMLKALVRGPGDLCEIIEEYRTGSTFDILASIGGLLALLQGLHVFLFGRPLFWGLFGAKIITPFGIFGRLATKGFRERLKNRYDPDSLSNQEREAIKQEAMLMTRFLLDYVVDLGPAEWPAGAQTQTPEQRNLLGEPSNTSSATAQNSQEQEGRQMP